MEMDGNLWLPGIFFQSAAISRSNDKPDLAAGVQEVKRVKVEIFAVIIEHRAKFVLCDVCKRRLKPRSFAQVGKLIAHVGPYW